MLIFRDSNSYGFASASITVYDNTYIQDSVSVDSPVIPEFNMLIPTVQEAGMTNQMELFQPGSSDTYVNSHGTPNMVQYGIGPNLIKDLLDLEVPNMGIYTVNLRGDSATKANVICYLKYWIEKDVPFKIDGVQQYDYHTSDYAYGPDRGNTEDTPIVRDVLHLKFETTSFDNCKSWIDLLKYMNLNVYNVSGSGTSARNHYD